MPNLAQSLLQPQLKNLHRIRLKLFDYNEFLILPAGLLLQASKANASGGPMNDEGMGVIPAQTQLSTSLSLNLGMAGKTVSIVFLIIGTYQSYL